MKYTYSGHESFPCKSLWIKKGYDFIVNGLNFNSSDAVVHLGVGKNMVSSIRYWLRCFNITSDDKLTDIAHYLFDNEKGKDPYLEDLGTLRLLHFLLVSKTEATLYYLLFIGLQKERKFFEKQQVANYVKRIMTEQNKFNQYNENTVKKDITTLLQMYVLPQKNKTYDDFSSLLIDLELIRYDADAKNYVFNIEGKQKLPWQIFLYSIIATKGIDNSVSYDVLQELGMIFCMNDMEVIEMCKVIETNKPNIIRYSDTAGIRQLQFIGQINKESVLDEYYG
jgi:hypothetical protein